MDAYAMKRVAAGAHLPTPWFFEPAKRPDDRADYTAWTKLEGFGNEPRSNSRTESTTSTLTCIIYAADCLYSLNGPKRD